MVAAWTNSIISPLLPPPVDAHGNAPDTFATTDNSRHVARLAYLRLLRRSVRSVFDVSELTGKLPKLGVNSFDLADIAAVPGGSDIYLHFGPQDTVAANHHSVSFAGAFVEQRDDGSSTSFGVHLICHSPGFEHSSIRVWLAGGKTVEENLQESLPFQDHWAEPAVHAQKELITEALGKAVKALIYLASPDADIGKGYVDEDRLQPIQYLVGRNIQAVDELEQPSRSIAGPRF